MTVQELIYALQALIADDSGVAQMEVREASGCAYVHGFIITPFIVEGRVYV